MDSRSGVTGNHVLSRVVEVQRIEHVTARTRNHSTVALPAQATLLKVILVTSHLVQVNVLVLADITYSLVLRLV